MKSAETIVEDEVLVYAHFRCLRCGKRIKWYACHRYNGIPEYCKNHHPNCGFRKGIDNFNYDGKGCGLKKGNKWRFRKGHKINLGRKHTAEWRKNMSKRMSGENNPNYGKHRRR